MIKEALNYLMNQGIKPESRFVEKENKLFSVDNSGQAERIYKNDVIKEHLRMNTLSGLVHYIKQNADNIDSKFVVQVLDEENVKLLLPLDDEKRRSTVAVVEAIVPKFQFDRFYEAEEFNIALQSRFVENDERNIVLKVVGNIRDEAVKSLGDDGVSQSVTIKTGTASVGVAKVPNPVFLQPYRTFVEVDQPGSNFIFRMRDGGVCALFEADGGAWRNQAIFNIKTYLEDQLADLIDNKILIIA